MEQFNMSENVDTLFQSFENFTQKEGVIGKPVTQNEKTFLPVVSVTIGYGGGNTAMGKGQGAGSTQSFASGNTAAGSQTGASGLGAKLHTEAIIIIDDQSRDVSVLPLTAAGVGQIVDKIPQILTGLNQNKQS